MQVRNFSGKRLEQARLRAGLTQADLAIAVRQRSTAKTTERNVRRWESGSSAPHAGIVIALANVLGVLMDELFGDGSETGDADAVLRRVAGELVSLGHDDLALDLQRLARVRQGERS